MEPRGKGRARGRARGTVQGGQQAQGPRPGPAPAASGPPLGPQPPNPWGRPPHPQALGAPAQTVQPWVGVQMQAPPQAEVSQLLVFRGNRFSSSFFQGMHGRGARLAVSGGGDHGRVGEQGGSGNILCLCANFVEFN